MAAILGIDVGGTFTDFFLWQGSRVEVYKRPSTPDDPSRAVLEGLVESGWLPDEIVHGSTVATNAVLERKGARTALITTRGFRDVLEIGRQTRPKLYDLEPRRPPPLVLGKLRFEAGERIDRDGRVLDPLAAAAVERLLDRIARLRPRVESLAVCFLFSFLNPDHERMVAQAARRRGIECSASFEVLPEYREYERTSTTVLNAYVAPVMRRYLSRLEAGFAGTKLRVMQSNGGSASPTTAGRLAATTLLSGPAGGVAGAFRVAKAAGFDRIITLDMGGTSTDVCLCDGDVPFTAESTIDGLPLRLPAVDVHTVGAGGGSIARLDAGGALRVGPESAGADPGPACYGHGDAPTVTDAHLLLGRLLPEGFLDGRMALSIGAARRSMRSIARAYGGDVLRAAEAVVRVANVNMERALRTVSVERGHDPRRFTLVAFGGAGPLHACELAESLGIARVLVPAKAGVLSAFGMAAAPVARDYARALLTALAPGDRRASRLESAFRRLESQAKRELADVARLRLRRAVDLRYAGQSYELTIDAPSREPTRLLAAFHRAHRRRYGHAEPSRPVELVAARLRAESPGPPLRLPPLERGDGDPRRARIGRRPVWHERQRAATVYDRELLRADDRLRGPALVLQLDATTWVAPSWAGAVDGVGNLVLEQPS